MKWGNTLKFLVLERRTKDPGMRSRFDIYWRSSWSGCSWNWNWRSGLLIRLRDFEKLLENFVINLKKETKATMTETEWSWSKNWFCKAKKKWGPRRAKPIQHFWNGWAWHWNWRNGFWIFIKKFELKKKKSWF